MTDYEFRDYTPFDDSQEKPYVPTDTDTGGSDTLEIDAFRQGVELKTNKQRFAGMQPKMWAGNLNHYVKVKTYGQARSFTEYYNSSVFEELPKFNPVSYIELASAYPLPILFNYGPSQEEEAYVEPITIPYRKWTPEGPFFAHRVAGAIEDGNDIDSVYKNANRTTQFVDYADPAESRWFLDEGTNYWGPVTNGIRIDGYMSDTDRVISPFNDTSDDDYVQNISGISSDMVAVLLRMKVDLNSDFRPSNTRSATAGTVIYGRDSAMYGTDSIAFAGTTRGT